MYMCIYNTNGVYIYTVLYTVGSRSHFAIMFTFGASFRASSYKCLFVTWTSCRKKYLYSIPWCIFQYFILNTKCWLYSTKRNKDMFHLQPPGQKIQSQLWETVFEIFAIMKMHLYWIIENSVFTFRIAFQRFSCIYLLGDSRSTSVTGALMVIYIKPTDWEQTTDCGSSYIWIRVHLMHLSHGSNLYPLFSILIVLSLRCN